MNLKDLFVRTAVRTHRTVYINTDFLCQNWPKICANSPINVKRLVQKSDNRL